MALRIRERAPLRLHATIDTPSGRSYRWAGDERNPENALGAGTFSSTAPGGFEQGSASLARKILHDFPDLEEFSTVTFRGAGGEVAGQFRLEGSPRQWGQQSGVQPQLNGWQNHLQDDNSAAMIYADQAQSGWTEPSITRQLAMTVAGVTYEPPSLGSVDATNGLPAIVLVNTFPTPGTDISEAIYDAGPACKIAAIRYAFNTNGVDFTNANWTWGLSTYTDDTTTSQTGTTGDLSSASSGHGYFTPAVPGRVGYMFLEWGVAAGGAGQRDELHWQGIAVYGDHGLTIQMAVDPGGFLASDVIAHAISKWAPKLAFTTGPGGTIQPTSFIITQLAFRDLTNAAGIIQQTSSFELLDWYVWEGPTFWLNEQGAYPRARNWRARVGPAQLQDTGPQVSRIFNGALVNFTDMSGVTRSVGPPGSGCDVEDASLLDPDPQNPANQLGIPRYGPNPPINIGTGTSDAAIRVGQGFLQEQKQFDTSGNATLTGWVEDDRGVLWPYWKVRGGDTVTFVDASDTSQRRIVRAEASDASKTTGIALDAPPEAMQQLLARLGDRNAQLGF